MTAGSRRTVIDSAHTLRRILAMEDEGRTRKQIATSLGLDYTRMCLELKAAGYPGRPGVRSALTEEQVAEGVRLITEEGLTYVQAAARLDVSRAALQNRLTERGVRVGVRVKMTDADVQEAAKLRRQGWTITNIARKFDVTEQTVTRRLSYHSARSSDTAAAA